jgi:hypothetical protein
MALPQDVRRWATFGPWYAMFPVDFVLQVIEEYSDPGDLVVDPFCGRGTTLFVAEALGRRGFGVEVNAVGWTYAATKLRPATEASVMKRLREMQVASRRADLPDLPQFFTKAYAPKVRKFLAAARDGLDWSNSVVDRTAMSMLLLYAHGNRQNALSNQMRQTKAMSPAYAIDWWAERDLKPPNIDPVEFLQSRIAWRYRHGSPAFDASAVALGDSTVVLPRRKSATASWSLLLTSPPYMNVANYHYDQWIRLWLLGGAPHPVVNGGKHQSWFHGAVEYRAMLRAVFSNLAPKAKRNAVVYVRTDARKATRDITIDVLRKVFPRKAVDVVKQPLRGPIQTTLYNEAVDSPGEIDIILY